MNAWKPKNKDPNVREATEDEASGDEPTADAEDDTDTDANGDIDAPDTAEIVDEAVALQAAAAHKFSRAARLISAEDARTRFSLLPRVAQAAALSD